MEAFEGQKGDLILYPVLNGQPMERLKDGCDTIVFPGLCDFSCCTIPYSFVDVR